MALEEIRRGVETEIKDLGLTAAIKSPTPATIIPLGLKGFTRGVEYVKVHRGPMHPYMIIFGPLGGLLIPEEELQPEKLKAEDKTPVLPMSPTKGPPLPKALGVKWPWAK